MNEKKLLKLMKLIDSKGIYIFYAKAFHELGYGFDSNPKLQKLFKNIPDYISIGIENEFRNIKLGLVDISEIPNIFTINEII